MRSASPSCCCRTPRPGGANALPLPQPTAARPVTLYTMGLNHAVAARPSTAATRSSPATTMRRRESARPSAAGADYAVIRVEVSNPASGRPPRIAATIPPPAPTRRYINPATGKTVRRRGRRRPGQRPDVRRRAAMGGQQPVVHGDGRVEVVGHLAVARRHPGRDEGGRARAHHPVHLLPPALRPRRRRAG